METVLTAERWQEGCRHLCRIDPHLATLVARYAGERLEPHGDVFSTLARAITGQQISVLAAERIWSRLCALLGRVTPEAVLGTGAEALAGCGLTRRKAASLEAIARGIAIDGRAMPSRRADLLALSGVGPWTADMVAIFALGEADILPVGDIGLQKAVAARYGLAREVVDGLGLERMARSWRPWRSIAVWHLWRDLDPVPVIY